MRNLRSRVWSTLYFCALLLGLATQAHAQAAVHLAACEKYGFSTEEDFRAGVETWDGNPLISDGDFLSPDGQVCARNWQLLLPWEIRQDLGLDAVDLIDAPSGLVSFSTEIADPRGKFTAGDLLATNGVIIPNAALLTRFQVGRDLGLDGLHFVGDPHLIRTFLEAATQFTREDWLTGASLPEWLMRYEIDIWFSVEGTERRAAAVPIYDGDILSARDGIIVLQQNQLMTPGTPAGIPDRGVDFGVDGIAGRRKPDRPSIRFSSEILYRRDPGFDDGDILHTGSGVETPHVDLIAAFKPRARFLGIDALHIFIEEDPAGGGDLGGQPQGGESSIYLPLVQTGQDQEGAGQ